VVDRVVPEGGVAGVRLHRAAVGSLVARFLYIR
jgi:hypothetical protein